MCAVSPDPSPGQIPLPPATRGQCAPGLPFPQLRMNCRWRTLSQVNPQQGAPHSLPVVSRGPDRADSSVSGLLSLSQNTRTKAGGEQRADEACTATSPLVTKQHRSEHRPWSQLAPTLL